MGFGAECAGVGMAEAVSVPVATQARPVAALVGAGRVAIVAGLQAAAGCTAKMGVVGRVAAAIEGAGGPNAELHR